MPQRKQYTENQIKTQAFFLLLSFWAEGDALPFFRFFAYGFRMTGLLYTRH